MLDVKGDNDTRLCCGCWEGKIVLSAADGKAVVAVQLTLEQAREVAGFLRQAMAEMKKTGVGKA